MYSSKVEAVIFSKQTLDIITSTTHKACMVGKMGQDEGIVVPTLFGCCLGIPSLHVLVSSL